MKKLVSLAVAASVIGLASAAFAAGAPAPASQGKTVQATTQDCSTIKDEKAKAECEKDKAKTQNSTKAPAAN